MDEILSYENEESLSDRYRLYVTIITVCMTLLGIYAIYAVFTSGIDWGFDIDWNCFKSPFFPVLAVIGFFLQFFNWQHTSMETWIGTKKPTDNDFKWKKSNDIMDVMFGGCLMPILSHLLIIPCIYGALMWYAIMGALHLLGKVSPFMITALIAGVVFMFYRLGNNISTNRYRMAILVIFTLMEGGILGGTAYLMKNYDSISIFNSMSVSSENAVSIGICKITGNGVNLRLGPGTDFEKSGMSVSAGETYPLLEESGDWVKIDYNGTPLWLSSKFCAITHKNDNGENTNIIYKEDDLGCWTGDEETETYATHTDTYEARQEGEASMESVTEPAVEITNPIPGATALTGKLDGKYEIVLQYLKDENGNVTGSYYYTKYKSPISISGEYDGTTMTLEERTNGNLTGRFIGRSTSDGFDGIWESADGSKTMDCTLRRIN